MTLTSPGYRLRRTLSTATVEGFTTGHQAKLTYAVKLSIEELLRKRYGVAIFATFTFRENITDKAEAQRRWRRLKERLRRWQPEPTQVERPSDVDRLPFEKPPIRGVGVWQRQKRGAWHLHMVFNQFISIEPLRAAALECGFGPMLNTRYVETRNQTGFSWNPRRVVSYMLRYVTRDFDSDQDKGVRVVEYFAARAATTSFSWARGFARLYRAGRQVWSDLFAEEGQPKLDHYWFIIRLGWETLTAAERAHVLAQSDGVAKWWDPEAFPF